MGDLVPQMFAKRPPTQKLALITKYLCFFFFLEMKRKYLIIIINF